MRRLLLVLLLLSSLSYALPSPSGGGAEGGGRYSAYIEMPRGYVSGMLVLLHEEETVKGSLFNEFGITALDFTYDRQKDKVKLHSVVKMMDRWYIRRVLRRDLREVLKGLEQGDSIYEDKRYHINYKFTPLHE